MQTKEVLAEISRNPDVKIIVVSPTQKDAKTSMDRMHAEMSELLPHSVALRLDRQAHNIIVGVSKIKFMSAQADRRGIRPDWMIVDDVY